jgi:archaemetzincin
MKRFLVLLAPLLQAVALGDAPLPVIALQPLGTVPPEIIATAQEAAEAKFRIRIEVPPAAPLPQMAYYSPRDRYRAEKLLDWLEQNPGKDAGRFIKIIGLTTRDISTTKGEIEDWGIFGLGKLDGTSCVISTHRLAAKEGQPATIRSERLVKIVTHEIGHTFGLPHCPTPGCVMQDAQGSILTVDREDGTFCA